ncbi:P-type ATPase (P-ATPase) Superfamily [Phytophthora palmivora]|uniref:P-type ATPase (P-ATPase) Superfamily n=1 Tax=Phytophthora palmivora TaxID=4796 RepID=A0A2P4XE98_9STRA|nr:P-type ATPase (P-ATPase) Superfamily [Phytophthora palmivora]
MDGCYVLSYRELPSDWTHEQMLKGDTADAIAKLKAGDIRTVMITGDNAMCGCYIARQSGMVSSSSRVILGEMVSTMEVKKLMWRDVDSEEEYDLPAVKHLVEQGEDVELAVTGVAFDYLVAMGEIKGLLLNICIFSRMTPDGKVECVKLHMETEAVTGMCGDGGNDCGALGFAHAGVALSDAEASVIVATSFASVKFLILYGLIGSVMWAVLPHAPLKELKAVRPTSSLIGPTTLVSMFGQQIVNVIFLCCSVHLLTSEVWYCTFSPVNIDVAKWWLMADNQGYDFSDSEKFSGLSRSSSSLAMAMGNRS